MRTQDAGIELCNCFRSKQQTRTFHRLVKGSGLKLMAKDYHFDKMGVTVKVRNIKK